MNFFKFFFLMYPRGQPISYSPYPPSNQAYPAVYYAQPVYPYHNFPGKMGPISYTPDNATMLTTSTTNPSSVAAQIPPQPDNLYINYQQPQQQILSQQSLTQQQQLSQQQLPPQHIHQQQQIQQQRQYDLSHQLSQIQQVSAAKQRPMVEQYIGQPMKNKPKPIYQTQISQPPQIPQIPKQMIQAQPQRNQMQPIMMTQQQQILQSQQRQYNPMPLKSPMQQSIEIQQMNQPYKSKQEDNSSSMNHKISFDFQDNEPPGCFDIIGRGNLPSIYFNTSISFS